MLLTEQEIFGCLPPEEDTIAFARAIESAVLEKLNVGAAIFTDYNEDVSNALWRDSNDGSMPHADVVRDAERYRWLRSENWFATGIIHEAPYGRTAHDSWEHLDAAIDAAMEKMK